MVATNPAADIWSASVVVPKVVPKPMVKSETSSVIFIIAPVLSNGRPMFLYGAHLNANRLPNQALYYIPFIFRKIQVQMPASEFPIFGTLRQNLGVFLQRDAPMVCWAIFASGRFGFSFSAASSVARPRAVFPALLLAIAR